MWLQDRIKLLKRSPESPSLLGHPPVLPTYDADESVETEPEEPDRGDGATGLGSEKGTDESEDMDLDEDPLGYVSHRNQMQSS